MRNAAALTLLAAVALLPLPAAAQERADDEGVQPAVAEPDVPRGPLTLGEVLRSTARSHPQIEQALAGVDIFIATAAVADYRPASASDSKIKRDGATRTLELVPNPDILASVAARDDAPFTVGFAAETNDVEAYARAKLERKRIDMIAANHVGGELGFDSDDNELTVLWNDGRAPLARASKPALARQLVELVATRYRASRGSGGSA